MNDVLGEYVDIILGGTPKTSIPEYWDGDIPWVTPGDIGTTKYINSTDKTITEAGLHNSNTKLLGVGDVIVSARGSVGKIIECDKKMAFNQSCYALRSKDYSRLIPSYVYYLTHSCVKYLQQNAAGAVFNTIIKSTLARTPVKIPSIDTQEHIASILSAYDDLIENNRRRIQLLEQSAQMLYKEWFIHLRFPGHEHVKIKDGVPEGWQKQYLPEVIQVNPKTTVEKGKEILYAPMSALSETNMTLDTSVFERRTKHTNVKFRKNDVLLARITPCLENGKTGFVHFLQNGEVGCGSTEFIVLRGKKVSPAFTYCLARSYNFRENAIKSMIGSSGRQRVQLSCFDDFVVPLPPNHLLKMFDETVGNNFEQIGNLIRQNDKLVKARDLLLPRLMNGEIAV